MKEIELQQYQPPPPPPPGQWSQFTRQMAIVLLIIASLIVLNMMLPVISLLAITGIVILILSFPLNLLRTKTKLPNAVATILVFLPVAVILFLLTSGLTNWFVQTVQSIVDQLKGGTELNRFLAYFLTKAQGDPEGAQQILSEVAAFIGKLLEFTTSFFFYGWTSLFLAFLFLLEMPSIFRNSFQSLSGVSHREFGILFNRMAVVWNGWLKSTVITALIIGAFTGLQLYLMGIPYAGAIGIAAGFLNLIPTFGPLITYVLIIIVTYTQGSSWINLDPLTLTILVLVINVLFNQFVRLVIYPKLAGKAVRLPVFLIILGLVIGAVLWGVLGVILVVPLLGTIREILTYLIRKINLQDPYPGEQIQGELWGKEKPSV